MDDHEVEEVLEQLDGLLARLEIMPGEEGEVARKAVTALTEVYGEALIRTVRLPGLAPDRVRALASDQLVGHLMALHGLHPDPPERRVEQAILDIQGHLHGQGSVEFAGLEGGVAQVRVTAAGCGSDKLATSVREVVLGSAPDLTDVEASSSTSTFIPLETVRRQVPR